MQMTKDVALYAMGALGVVSLGCSVAGHAAKPGKLRTVLLTIAAVGPLDVVRAWRLWTAVLPVALLMLTGCTDPATAAAQQAEIATYAAQQQQCVTLAGTRGQAEDCIKSVRFAWCGPKGALYEAGACSYDGGEPVMPEMTLDGGAQ